MTKLAWAAVAMAVALSTADATRAQSAVPSDSATAISVEPLRLDAQPEQYESVYAPPENAGDEKGTNQGGLNIDLRVGYLSDYIWRGIDRSESGGAEDSANFQFDGQLKWDAGKFPHPFVGLFSNVYDADPISRFQEIRPYFGFEWTDRPITLSLGHSNYIYPDRDQFNTAEVWTLLKVDDSYFFRTEEPIFSPYLLVAYDYDTNHGFYMELGISHDFVIENTPLTITPEASIAYVDNNKEFRAEGASPTDPAFSEGTTGPDSGFQHYQLGVEITYGMNQLLNLSTRFGKIDFKGYLFYTDGISDELRASTEIWGGVGLRFTY